MALKSAEVKKLRALDASIDKIRALGVYIRRLPIRFKFANFNKQVNNSLEVDTSISIGALISLNTEVSSSYSTQEVVVYASVDSGVSTSIVILSDENVFRSADTFVSVSSEYEAFVGLIPDQVETTVNIESSYFTEDVVNFVEYNTESNVQLSVDDQLIIPQEIYNTQANTSLGLSYDVYSEIEPNVNIGSTSNYVTTVIMP